MDSIVIQGGSPIVGEIDVSGSKNASLPMMALSLLTDDDLVLTNVPKLSDINTMHLLLSKHGTKVTVLTNGTSLKLQLSSKEVSSFTAPYEVVRRMRASIWVLGPLLSRFGQAKVSFPGGCAIGVRHIDLHLAVMEALGASIAIEKGYIVAKSHGRLQGCNFKFAKRSVGATINAILAAVLADGESNFTNCAMEPEIVDLCKCLLSMGAEIYGIGNAHLKIIGKESLSGTEYKVLPDRIEAGSYMIASAATRGNLLIKGINLGMLKNIVCSLMNSGIYVGQEKHGIRVKHSGDIKPTNISTEPYPGFSTDFQAQFMSLMAIANGPSEIHENIFENRFMHVPELCRMGADIAVNGNKALINGVSKLKGAEVMASDLRASISLVIAGLVADGETKIHRVYHLDRGYQDLEKKLANCGVNIIRITGDTV